MYQLEDLDVNRFVHLLRKQRYKSHWEDYWQNLYDQMQPTEFKIQKWWGSKVDLIGKSVSILNSEHSYPMKDIIPNNVEVVLSGNDLTKRGHINKINSISELADQAGVTEIIFEDEIVFDYHDELGPRHYKQFLIYGKK